MFKYIVAISLFQQSDTELQLWHFVARGKATFTKDCYSDKRQMH